MARLGSNQRPLGGRAPLRRDTGPEGLHEYSLGSTRIVVVMQGSASPRRLSQGEQRVLDSFYAGRLPAGQLHAELCRARDAELADAATRESPAAARLSLTARALPLA
jgi:hypothetical protein